MAGFGRIGGGGSCWLNFTVNHGDGKEKWSAYDANVGKPKVKVKFPEGFEKEVELAPGETVHIEWS